MKKVCTIFLSILFLVFTLSTGASLFPAALGSAANIEETHHQGEGSEESVAHFMVSFKTSQRSKERYQKSYIAETVSYNPFVSELVVEGPQFLPSGNLLSCAIHLRNSVILI